MSFIQTAGLRYNVIPDVTRIAGIYNIPMLQRLSAIGNLPQIGQRLIKWNVDTGYGAVTAEASTADVSTFASDVMATASLAIGDNRLRRSFTILNNELTEAANIGVGEIADLLQFEVDTAIESLTLALATRLYVAGSNSGIDKGIADLGATATSNKSTVVYAGLDPATYTKWTNLVYKNSGTPRALTVALLRTVLSDVKSGATIGTNSNVTALYMNPTTANAYKALFDARVLPQYGAGVADVSYSTLQFEGLPIIEDPYAPVGNVFFINENQVKLYTYEHKDSLGTIDQANGVPGLSFYVAQLPSANPEAAKFSVSVNPQLAIRNRAAVAQLGDLS
jgi:hypothetical protein